MIHIQIHLEAADQTFKPDDFPPQSIQVTLHSRPTKLRVRKSLRNHPDDLWGRMRCRTLTQHSTPDVVTRINENLKRPTGRPGHRCSNIVGMMQNRTFGQHVSNCFKSVRALRFLVKHIEICTLLSVWTQRQFMSYPSWVHVLTQVIHEAKERSKSLCRRRLAPLF